MFILDQKMSRNKLHQTTKIFTLLYRLEVTNTYRIKNII